MNREDAHVEMLVVFGNPNDGQTVGKIVVVNPARAKVVTLDEREGRPVGTRFNVPYFLLKRADDQRAPAS